jgi:hypothetical protein
VIIAKEKITPDLQKPMEFSLKEKLPFDATLQDWQFNSAFARDFGRSYGSRVAKETELLRPDLRRGNRQQKNG